jgi:two-component system, NarL family, sensor histidine kinase UhpB
MLSEACRRRRPRYAVAVNTRNSSELRRRHWARRDIVIVILIACAAAIICVKFDVSEALASWTRLHENLQLDELPGVLLVLAICLIWFSARRYLEANRELTLRRTMEAKLAEALAENQHLALKYVDTQESERKTLAHDLHDELGQYVNAIKLDAVAMRDATTNHAALNEAARAMIVNIDRVYHVLRGLIRELRPVGFDDLGVLAALEHCVNEWRPRLPAARIEFSCAPELDMLDEARRLVVFRLVQEALTNIARHSSATEVHIRIERSAPRQGIEVSIIDNGVGADLSLPRNGLGLVGMRERVAALGGTTDLASARGEGFKIMAFLPVAQRDGVSAESGA